MGQNILPCIIWENTKESEHLTLIPLKLHQGTSLSECVTVRILDRKWVNYAWLSTIFYSIERKIRLQQR